MKLKRISERQKKNFDKSRPPISPVPPPPPSSTTASFHGTLFPPLNSAPFVLPPSRLSSNPPRGSHPAASPSFVQSRRRPPFPPRRQSAIPLPASQLSGCLTGRGGNAVEGKRRGCLGRLRPGPAYRSCTLRPGPLSSSSSSSLLAPARSCIVSVLHGYVVCAYKAGPGCPRGRTRVCSTPRGLVQWQGGPRVEAINCDNPRKRKHVGW